MSIKEDLELIGRKVIEYSGNRFTGKMVLTIHMRDGGIGKMNLVSDCDIKKSEKRPSN